VSEAFLLGIDIGTTTCRATVFDLEGREIAASYREMRVRYPRPLWAEIDPEDWWQATINCVRSITDRIGVDAHRIGGIGLSGLMHAPVLLDAAGNPITPAMLWMDQRCAPQVAALRQAFIEQGLNPDHAPATGLSAPKLRWLADTHPNVLARACTFVLPKDFVRFRMTGVAGTDPSDAGGTGMFDRVRGVWHEDIVRLVGVPRALLPAISTSASLAGCITADAAALTGLAAGTPVAMGGSDTLCSRLGAGGLGFDEICLYLGTAAWIVITGGPGEDGRPVPRAFGATSTTGAALRWVRDRLLESPSGDISASYDAMTDLAESAPPGAEGLFFLPHLMGERGPSQNPQARGALVGLTLRHGRAHIVRSVLEGTAFQLRRIVEARSGGQPPTIGVACGGATRSALWMHMLADVTGLTMRVPEAVEVGALGAAMLGGEAAGLLTVASAPARMVRFSRTYTPDPAAAARYDRRYIRFCRLDDLLTPWFLEEQGEDDEHDA
jgi:xylulokinase